ncbi:MAG: VOC family protein [Vulcanimicrobiaceae bacterium]
MQLNPYLFFSGNCEEALTFYSKVFDGKIVGVNRYEGSPMESRVPADFKTKIMHASFEADGLSFMAADSSHDGHSGGSRIALSVATKDGAAGERVFNELATGGTVTMALGEVFWGGRFGSVTDRYGIDWMVSCF